MYSVVRIGEILVQQGVLRSEQVDHIVAVQQRVGRPFGDLAERLFGIDPRAVESAWIDQYAGIVEKVDLSQFVPDNACLRLITRRQAWQFHIAPLRRVDGELQVVTCRESLMRALNFSNHVFAEPVVFVVAEHESLKRFLMQHYPVPEFMASTADQFERH